MILAIALDTSHFCPHDSAMDPLLLSRGRRFVGDLLACLRFYSRLPVPDLGFEADPYGIFDFAHSIRALPLAGAIIGGAGGIALVLASGIGLPSPLASAIALAVLVAITGAFHEDGLADMADGFGGGTSAPQKLQIMRDSRIGSYGAVALVLSLLIRAAALAALVDRSGSWSAGAALITASAVSRTAALTPLVLLPPARRDGAGFAAARPDPAPLRIAIVLAMLIAVGLGEAAGHGLRQIFLGGLLAWGAGLGTAWLAHRQIGGQTGDVAGATQQMAEIVYLCANLIDPKSV